jgi:hypothetical protein
VHRVAPRNGFSRRERPLRNHEADRRSSVAAVPRHSRSPRRSRYCRTHTTPPPRPQDDARSSPASQCRARRWRDTTLTTRLRRQPWDTGPWSPRGVSSIAIGPKAFTIARISLLTTMSVGSSNPSPMSPLRTSRCAASSRNGEWRSSASRTTGKRRALSGVSVARAGHTGRVGRRRSGDLRHGTDQ